MVIKVVKLELILIQFDTKLAKNDNWKIFFRAVWTKMRSARRSKQRASREAKMSRHSWQTWLEIRMGASLIVLLFSCSSFCSTFHIIFHIKHDWRSGFLSWFSVFLHLLAAFCFLICNISFDLIDHIYLSFDFIDSFYLSFDTIDHFYLIFDIIAPFNLSIIHLFNWSALIDEDKDLGQVTKIIKILILNFFW